MIQFLSRVYSVTRPYTQKHSELTTKYVVTKREVKPRRIEERDFQNVRILKTRTSIKLRFSSVVFRTY